MADDLFCCERLQPELPRGECDPVIYTDMRVLQNLLHLEKIYTPSRCYFTHVQKDIKPFMRQVVCTWMLEVCDALLVEDQVFPLAVNLLDRFLSCCPIRKRHLQLAASVCILMACKVRQCQSIRPESLCYYSDHSITLQDIKDWELLILSKLNWDVTSVTAHDLVTHMVERMDLGAEHSLIRTHATTLVGVLCTDSSFVLTLPSVMAAACVASAARGMRPLTSASTMQSICTLLGGATTPDEIEPIVQRIEEALEAEAANFNSQAASRASHPVTVTPHKRSSTDSCPETPIDVSDINF